MGNNTAKLVQNIINDESLDGMTISELRSMLLHFQDSILGFLEEDDEEEDEGRSGKSVATMTTEELLSYIL